jgi:hypothetical protein
MQRYLICALGCAAMISSSFATSIIHNPALPPAYLSVPGFKNCLHTLTHHTCIHSANKKKRCSKYTSWCLPKNKPSQCSTDSWQQLQDKVPACPI